MLTRKTTKAAVAKGRAFPVDKRRAFYRAEAVGFRWPMTEAEAAFSAALVARLLAGCPFYHGGGHGLPTGADLLPAKDTGKDPQGLRGAIPARLTHTYVTTSFVEAVVYAARAAAPDLPGMVYRVLPVEPIEADPEAIRCLCLMLADAQMVESFGTVGLIEMTTAFRCTKATVLGEAMRVEWVGSRAQTNQQALSLAFHLGPLQMTGPEGWGQTITDQELALICPRSGKG